MSKVEALLRGATRVALLFCDASQAVVAASEEVVACVFMCEAYVSEAKVTVGEGVLNGTRRVPETLGSWAVAAVSAVVAVSALVAVVGAVVAATVEGIVAPVLVCVEVAASVSALLPLS